MQPHYACKVPPQVLGQICENDDLPCCKAVAEEFRQSLERPMRFRGDDGRPCEEDGEDLVFAVFGIRTAEEVVCAVRSLAEHRM